MAGYELFNGVEDREEVPGHQKHPWPARAQKNTECPLPSTNQKHEGKAPTKPSPELLNLPPCTRCWGTIWGWSPSRCCCARSLRPIMWPWGPKNARKSSRRWSTAIVKRIFENFGILSLKVKIGLFQIVIILRKLTTL